MKKATSDFGLIVIDNIFVGISLGYDFTAEHEWGIKDMKRLFNIPELSKKTLGIKSRTITKCPDNIIFKEETYKKRKFALLFTAPSWMGKVEIDKYIPYDLENYKENIIWSTKYEKDHPRENTDPKDPISTAWDGGSFGVGVMGEENVVRLKELYNALQNNNVSITPMNPTPNNPFSNASLSLLITDKIPEIFKEQMYLADKEYQDKIDYEKKIGMTKLKENTRKDSYNNLYGHKHGYYVACIAEWIDYHNKEIRNAKKKEYNTKYDILYWVNYSDDDNTHDYFTVEEVREWLKGKKKLSEIRARNEKK